MMGRRRPIAALALLALAAAASPAVAAPADRCAAPREFGLAGGPLPATEAAVRQRRALRVLVVGTGSSFAGGPTGPATPYPIRLGQELAIVFPGIAASVRTLGGSGLTAAGLLPLLADGLAAFSPDLVVWQTGTVDAVRGLDPEGFAGTIEAGVERALAHRADLVLMDMQFSRLARATANFGPYREAIAAVAAATPGVVAFRRYALMRHWAEAGQIDVERAPRPDWQAKAELLHACLARVLAALIRDGARQAGR